jgi:hypothetical protein
MPVKNISLPFNNWRPRKHQEALSKYLENGGKRAMAVWHRRAGKDEICLHHAAVSMAERPGIPRLANCDHGGAGSTVSRNLAMPFRRIATKSRSEAIGVLKRAVCKSVAPMPTCAPAST